MEDLIQEYREGKKALQDEIKSIQGRIQRAANFPEVMEALERDRSILNGMVRDMNEAIQMMQHKHHISRGKKNIFSMDPFEISRLNIPAADLDHKEDEEKKRWMEILGERIHSRIHLLTNKQKSTLTRWIFDGKTISQIAREDGVARQNVWERIFGSRTHPGALRKLREEKGEKAHV